MSDYYTSGFEPSRISRIAEQFGFCLIKNLFSAAETSALEDEMRRLARTDGNIFPDLYSCPSLRWIMLHPKVLDVAHALLGEKLIYYRETAINFENGAGNLTNDPYRDLHRDGRGNPASIDGISDTHGRVYGAYRFGVYLRDYRNFSGGLKVVPGSHKLNGEIFRSYRDAKLIHGVARMDHWIGASVLRGLPTPPFEMYNVPSTPGDLVVFNLNVFHSAGALRPVERPTFSLLPMVETQLYAEAPGALLPYPKEGRNTIFFDYGAPAEDADLYIKWRAIRGTPSSYQHAELSNQHLSDLEIRNDKIIVGLALKLGEALPDVPHSPQSASSLDQLSAPVRRDAEKLLILCRQHREFSPHHALFDRRLFDDLETRDPIAALRVVFTGITAKRNEAPSPSP